MGCNEPGTPVNGVRTWTQTSAGSIAHYSCNFGYQLVGVSSIICSKGRWTAAVPKCESK